VTAEPPELPDLVDPPAALLAILRRDLPRGAGAGLETFWSLAKAMIPAYGLALVLEKLGVVTVLAHVAQPVMSLVGLPGSAALPLVLGYVLNVYAAVGAMTALHLSAQQITVLALAILIGHNLLVEGAVLRKAGMSGVGFGVLRALSGLLAAGVANLLMKAVS
jgi:spore maturation protein SpmB